MTIDSTALQFNLQKAVYHTPAIAVYLTDLQGTPQIKYMSTHIMSSGSSETPETAINSIIVTVCSLNPLKHHGYYICHSSFLI
jgi:hypothetical protein